jgi:hypothetical protein
MGAATAPRRGRPGWTVGVRADMAVAEIGVLQQVSLLLQAGQVTKVAAFGYNLLGGGTLAEFAVPPLPSLNRAGHTAFAAQIAGRWETERVFFAGADGLRAIALGRGRAIGRFALSAIATAGPAGEVTFATLAAEGEPNAIYCRWPEPAR